MISLPPQTDPETPGTMDVYCNRRKVGEVMPVDREYGVERWHAILHVIDPTECYHAGLALGHGDSPLAAVQDAFGTSRGKAETFLQRLDELEGELFGPYSAHADPPNAPQPIETAVLT